MLPEFPTSGPLTDGVAAGHATLVLDLSFGRRLSSLDWWSLTETVREAQPDRPGWDGLHLGERLELCRQALGAETFAARVAEHLPTFEALRAEVDEFHRTLLEPFQVVVTVGSDDLAAATFAALGQPFATISDDEWSRPLPGERRVVKLFGDALFGPHPGEGSVRRMPRERPRVTAALRARAAAGPVFFYGFSARDPQLDWLVDVVFGGAGAGGAWLAARQASPLLSQAWEARGVRLVGGGTSAEIERQTTRFAKAVLARRRPAGDAVTTCRGLAADIAERMVEGVAQIAPWTAAAGPDVEAVDDAALVSDALQALEALALGGLPVPRGAAARAADVLGRCGRRRRAADALRLTLSLRGPLDATGEACLGRAFVRVGDHERGGLHLERALEHGPPTDRWARADELGWLSRCVLDRAERLRRLRRNRGVLETVAAFLSGQAPRLELAALDPGEDEARTRTAYYLNLRLGQVMILAGEMARSSAAIYANQAVELLVRAAQLQPEKPDPYRALRPLLTEPEMETCDSSRWAEIVSAAPEALRRKLRLSDPATGTA